MVLFILFICVLQPWKLLSWCEVEWSYLAVALRLLVVVVVVVVAVTFLFATEEVGVAFSGWLVDLGRFVVVVWRFFDCFALEVFLLFGLATFLSSLD